MPAPQVPGDQRGVTIAAWCFSDCSGDANGVLQVVIADVLCGTSLDLCVEVDNFTITRLLPVVDNFANPEWLVANSLCARTCAMSAGVCR